MHKYISYLYQLTDQSSASFTEIIYWHNAKSILPSQLQRDTYEKDNTFNKNVNKQKTLNLNKCGCLLKNCSFALRAFSVLLFQTPVGRLYSGSLLPLCGLDENDT